MFYNIIKITTLVVAIGGMAIYAVNNCPEITPSTTNTVVAAEIETSDITEEVAQITNSIEDISQDLIDRKEAEEAEKEEITAEEYKRMQNYERNPYEVTNVYKSKYVRNDTMVYSGAGLGFSQLGIVEKGTLVLITGTTDNNWCRIQSEYGIAYMPAAQLAINKPRETEEIKQTGAIMSYILPSIATTHTTSNTYETTVIDWINDARKATGLNELIKDISLTPGLERAVESKSQDEYINFAEELDGSFMIITSINHSDDQHFIASLMEDEEIRNELLSDQYTRIQYYAISGDPGYIGIVVAP